MCPFTALKFKENKANHHAPNNMPASPCGPSVIRAELIDLSWLLARGPAHSGCVLIVC